MLLAHTTISLSAAALAPVAELGAVRDLVAGTSESRNWPWGRRLPTAAWQRHAVELAPMMSDDVFEAAVGFFTSVETANRVVKVEEAQRTGGEAAQAKFTAIQRRNALAAVRRRVGPAIEMLRPLAAGQVARAVISVRAGADEIASE